LGISGESATRNLNDVYDRALMTSMPPMCGPPEALRLLAGRRHRAVDPAPGILLAPDNKNDEEKVRA
jgi:hypothetical protein